MNPLRVTVEGQRGWRWYVHLVNDNNLADGSHGSVLRNGRLFVNSRAAWADGQERHKSSDVLRIEWSFRCRLRGSIDAEVRFEHQDGNDVQLHLALAGAASVWLTVHLHPRLVGWLPKFGNRVFGLRLLYAGSIAWLLLGRDEWGEATGMVGHALEHPDCAACGMPRLAHAADLPGGGRRGGWGGACQAYSPRRPTALDRLRERRGVLVKVRLRPRDWLFGRPAYTSEVVREERVAIPLDGREYEGVWQLERAEWRRPRAFWRTRLSISSELKVEHPPAFSGKGENSWDCGDDGIFSLSCRETTPSGAIGEYVKHVLRNRERYGRPSDPDAFQPKEELARG